MIFCFSGTGNSRWIAETLARELCDKVVLITCAAVEYDVAHEERVVWVFPIYSWGLPPIVKHFLRDVTLKNDINGVAHYMVCSCGDDVGLAHKQWRQMIKKRQWNVRSSFSVQMPNTYTLMKGFDVDNAEITQQKLAAAPARIACIAQQIKNSYQFPSTDDVVTGHWAWLKTRIIYPYFMRFCMSPRPFHATHDCVGCGRCARECPLQNIAMVGRTPQWNDKCTMCLRCYHTCPQHAVAYGKATRGKGQYLYPSE